MLNKISRTNTTRTLAIVVLGLVLSTRALQGQDRSRYRDLRLGGDLPSVSALSTVPASDANTIRQRPAVMQELEWRPPYFVSGSMASQNDPVRQVVFTFSNDQLSKMVVDSDRDRTAGMIDADRLDAISTAHGPSLKPAVKKTETVTPQTEGKGILPWGLRRAGAGVELTVSGIDISIQRYGFDLSKSVKF